MRKLINKSLIKGSFILLFSFGIFNVLNFLFQFAMARLLTIAEYGIMSALFSIFYILGVFVESIQTVITKYSSTEKDEGRLKNLFKRTFKKSLNISLLLFFVYLLVSIPLSYLLKITYPLMALNGLMIFAAFLSPIPRGVMQGRKMFTKLGINMIVEGIFKLVISILLVFFGWHVYGAIFGSILAVFIALGFSFPQLKSIIKAKEKKAKTSKIYSYTKPVFLITFTIIAFFSLDIIIAKIVFADDIAGYYALASVLAKTIFIGTWPIARAMFPYSAENKSKKPSGNIYLNALSITSAIIVVSLIVIYFFPNLLIRIFAGRYINESAGILFFIAIAAGFLSLTNLNLLYKLSLGKLKGYALFPLFLIVEIGLLLYFSANIIQYSIAFVLATTIFLWGSIVLLKE